MPVQIKWAYEKPSASDGVRILVDGLWPRGQSKEKLKIAEWMRDIAPSAALRKWYGHKLEKWEAFRKKYRQELKKQPRRALLDELIRRAQEEPVTLVFAARDRDHSNAAVLAEAIREARSSLSSPRRP